MADIFISYASEDRSRVAPFAKALENAGWSVWWDRTIPPGKTYVQVIKEAISAAKCVVVLWSHNSIESDWVQEEAGIGKQRSILIPAKIDAVEPPLGFGLIQAADLTDWQGDTNHPQYLQLLEATQDVLGFQSTSGQVSQTVVDAGDLSERVGQRTAPSQTQVVYATRGGYELVRIPGGQFLMGCPDPEKDRSDDEGPQHAVRLPGFFMGRCPVTNEEYGRFLVENVDADEPEYWGNREFNQPRQPVVGVSWADALQYARWAGLQLPSEAQWEYACRAGTQTRFYSGETQEDLAQVGWYDVNSGNKLHSVGQKEPNRFGLYDIHGNVLEWVEDAWHDNYESAPDDGRAWIDDPRGSSRVIRGGCWINPARYCRSAFRYWAVPDGRDVGLGFRLVLPPGQQG